MQMFVAAGFLLTLASRLRVETTRQMNIRLKFIFWSMLVKPNNLPVGILFWSLKKEEKIYSKVNNAYRL